MRQFILPDDAAGAGEIRLSGSDSRYLLRVLRLKTGDEFPASDRAGNRYMLRISETGDDHLLASATKLE